MNKDTIYYRLKEATAMADVIEASETGYISLNDDSIRDLDEMLLRMIDEVREIQHKKISGAATPETMNTH